MNQFCLVLYLTSSWQQLLLPTPTLKRNAIPFGTLQRIPCLSVHPSIYFIFLCPFPKQSFDICILIFRVSIYFSVQREGVNKNKTRLFKGHVPSALPPHPLNPFRRQKKKNSLFYKYFFKNCTQTGVAIQKNFLIKKVFQGMLSIFYILTEKKSFCLHPPLLVTE